MILLQAILLGLVQGLTEFLPISSTAHLRVLPALLGWDDPGAAFSAVIQLGTVAAVLVYFRTDLLRMARGVERGIRSRDLIGDSDARQALLVVAGSVPIIVAGLLFKDFITTRLRSLYIIAAALIVVGLLMALAEVLSARRAAREATASSIRFGDAVVIGLAQACALIPGVSRSGSTLAMGLFRGQGRAEAARFSFLLSIPAITGAGVLAAFDLGRIAAEGDSHLHMAVGTLVAFVTGYATIGGLISFLTRRSVHGFVAYRLLLGMALFVLSWMGLLPPGAS
ncbi:undecaprenyl-diphosphatase UppP [Myxococcus sp. SDU36]|uniref:undecaprenyl-diphosphatase UppP n=1 Tax=Myxococcus sp. SDU36 TaxID=2831967 RepID=UPI002542AEFA|nr:undecaprenyl-diphosphatase UppP [Myxococcus sp. SDU36]WIG97917.1 undecaprenyl-diphosphatase UppP [Myxococcus sp. SDU36]